MDLNMIEFATPGRAEDGGFISSNLVWGQTICDDIIAQALEGLIEAIV